MGSNTFVRYVCLYGVIYVERKWASRCDATREIIQYELKSGRRRYILANDFNFHFRGELPSLLHVRHLYQSPLAKHWGVIFAVMGVLGWRYNPCSHTRLLVPYWLFLEGLSAGFRGEGIGYWCEGRGGEGGVDPAFRGMGE
jgi:hypothetical protein